MRVNISFKQFKIKAILTLLKVFHNNLTQLFTGDQDPLLLQIIKSILEAAQSLKSIQNCK